MTAQSELDHLRDLYNQTSAQLSRSDRNLAKTEGDYLQASTELASVQQRVRDLEKDRTSLDRQVADLKNGNTLLRGSLTQVEQERECLLTKIDALTENVSTLEQDLQAKEYHILSAEETATRLQARLDIAIPENTALEQKLHNAQQALRDLRPRLEASEKSRASAEKEAGSLKTEVTNLTQKLASVCKDAEKLCQNLQNITLEKEELKSAFVRTNEEKNEMLEQLRNICTEAKALEERNQNLEKELQIARAESKKDEARVEGMINELRSWEVTVRRQETKMSELKEQLEQANFKLNKANEKIGKLEVQKTTLSKQLDEEMSLKDQLQLEVDHMAAEKGGLKSEMKNDRAQLKCLEQALKNAKQEREKEKLDNINLQNENCQLRKNVGDLSDQLFQKSSELQRYTRQVADLKHERADAHRREIQQTRTCVSTRATSPIRPETRLADVPVPTARCNPLTFARSPVQYPITTVQPREECGPHRETYATKGNRQRTAAVAEIRQQRSPPERFGRVHSTFTSTGPGVAAWHAKHTVVRKGSATETPTITKNSATHIVTDCASFFDNN
ncbi:testis-specific gene 10 protein-like isoform X3 [Bacillus rossius redtenbacheri]|uniref:testis-specific gene 10 protein-like isoform X2 n=1 Tax=Bacillus rossius redtenbacheri TaxID=93214 RepID=UPI002FDF020F